MTMQEYLAEEAKAGRFVGERLVDETSQLLKTAHPKRSLTDLRAAVKQTLADFEYFDGEPTGARYLADLVDRDLGSNR